MKKVVLVTTLFSPFQVECANEINNKNILDYYIIFTKTSYKGRDKHWNSVKPETNNIIINEYKSRLQKFTSLKKSLNAIKPDLIVIGQIRGIVPTVCRFYAIKYNIPFIFWLEQPFPKKNRLGHLLKYFDCYLNIWGTKNIIGIGDRAVKYYSKFAPSFLIPYSQDLNFINSNYKIKGNEKVHFLFSGQLIQRHNIHIIIKAIELLYNDVGLNFKFIFAAKGELKYLVDNFIKSNLIYNSIIEFDFKYNNWNDRLIPFSKSDVLIYPSNHSGWGLVIPEALACGLFVITTNKVESARYFIKHNENGLLINETSEELYISMKKCIVDRKWLEEKQKKSLLSYTKGDVAYVAPKLINHFLESMK